MSACRVPRTGLLRLLSCLSIAALGGCVSVRIDDPDGGVRIVRGFGVVSIEAPSPRTAVSGMVSGFGLVQAPLGWSAGFTRQRWALMGPECRAVIWPSIGGIDESTRAALVRTAGVCLLADDPSAAVIAANTGAKP
jgi:hypothetical protein